MAIPEEIYNDIDVILAIPRKHESELRKNIEVTSQTIENLVAAQQQMDGKPDLAELYYLLGYVLYLHPDRTKVHTLSQKTENALLFAIDIDNEFSMAWLYLGYNSYDHKRYSQARTRFQKAQKNYLAPFFCVKLLEIRLCCEIRERGLENVTCELKELVEQSEQFVREGELSAVDVVPVSLDRTIQESKELSIFFSQKEIKLLFERLDKVADVNWFSSFLNTEMDPKN